jgi:hypothetical protein
LWRLTSASFQIEAPASTALVRKLERRLWPEKDAKKPLGL